MGLKHTYTATGTNDATKQVSVTRWNEDHAVIADLNFPANAAPATPAAATLGVFARNLGGRMMLAQIGPSGLDTILQPHLGGNKVALWMPPGNATTVPGVFGMGTMTATGTVTARNVATTNLLTRMTRLGYVSATSAASLSGIREGVSKYTTGAGGAIGGFHLRFRFGVSDPATVSGARMFVGLSAATGAPTNVNPDTLVNSVGVSQLSTSTNLHIVWNGATATNAAIDLGASFPCTAASVDAYELVLFAAPAGGTIEYQVTRLNTGDTASGSLTVNLPLSTVLMGSQLWRTNNATALAVGLDVARLYIETDY